VVAGVLSLIQAAPTELTIASGAVTVTQGLHTIDTEGDAASDDLDTINGGTAGMSVRLRAENAARTVVLKDGTGNLELGGADVSLDDTDKWVELTYGRQPHRSIALCQSFLAVVVGIALYR